MPTDDHERELLLSFTAELGGSMESAEADLMLRYLDAMLEENTMVNLTAVRERSAALALHACDALGAVAALAQLDGGFGRTLDLGTGNGFPGIGICCLDPEAKVTMMDRTQKKVRAINHCLERVELAEPRAVAVAVDAGQAHALGYKQAFDTVVSRAVGPPADVAKLAGPLLHSRGRLLLWCSTDQELPDKLRPGFGRRAAHTYRLPAPADRDRVLAVYGRG